MEKITFFRYFVGDCIMYMCISLISWPQKTFKVVSSLPSAPLAWLEAPVGEMMTTFALAVVNSWRGISFPSKASCIRVNTIREGVHLPAKAYNGPPKSISFHMLVSPHLLDISIYHLLTLYKLSRTVSDRHIWSFLFAWWTNIEKCLWYIYIYNVW